MADTIRTLAQLQALLADNTIGNISAQDIRDLLVSVFNFVNDGAGNVSLEGNIDLNGSISLSAGKTVDGLDVSTLIAHKGASGAGVHGTGSQSVPGFMSTSDKSKIDGVEAGADVTANNAPKGHTHQAGDITTGELQVARIPFLTCQKYS